MTPRSLPYILLLTLAAVVCYGFADAYQRGHADGIADAVNQSVAARVRVVRTVDSVYIRDTLRLTRWRERWDSVRVTDTVTVGQVVYVPRPAADSVLSACYAVLRSCEARVAARDSVITALKSSLRAEQRSKPTMARVVVDRAVWAAVGVGIGAVFLSR